MAAPARYTGQNTIITFAGVIISVDYTEITVDLTQRIEERTAGNDTDGSYNATIKEGKGTFKRYDTAEADGGIAALLRIGTTGNLYIWPKNQITGKPILALPIMWTHVKAPYIFDKNTIFDYEFVKNGAMIWDQGSLV